MSAENEIAGPSPERAAAPEARAVTSVVTAKGMRDLLPPETRVWNRVEAEARAVFGLYGYDEIRTPVLEPTELFVRSVGESSDIVNKEMFSFRHHDQHLTLRPENTAGVARAFVQHRMAQAGGSRKLWYMGPQFRAERKQAHRYREFRQIGAEVLGAADPATDAEVLVMLFDLFGRLGFSGLEASLNSVGTEACRPAYVEALRAFLTPHASLMGEDDRRRLEQNPLRVLDTKDPGMRDVLERAPQMLEFLDPESREHHESLLALLESAGVPYRIEPRLVRGLDYYTRTVFEVSSASLGAQSALLGGGRYDRLVSDLGGPRTPGIGFAIGEDRLVAALPEAVRAEALGSAPPVALIPLEAADRSDALKLATELRRAGVPVDLDPSGRGPGHGLKNAERRGARVAVLLGGNERASATAVVKDLRARSQETVPWGELVHRLKGGSS